MNAISVVAGRIYEVGPNRPLRAFFRTMGRDVSAIVSIKHAESELS